MCQDVLVGRTTQAVINPANAIKETTKTVVSVIVITPKRKPLYN